MFLKNALDLRDCHARIREMVHARDLDLAIVDAGFLSFIVVLQMSSLTFNSVQLNIYQSDRVWMCHFAVKTLVVVVCQRLPIISTFHSPSMVEVVLGEVKAFRALLGVNAFALLIPRDLRYLGGVKVDPDETKLVDVNMNREKSVLIFVKIFYILKIRRLRKSAIETIRPPVIFAGQYTGLALVLMNQWEAAMAAYVMESTDLPFPVDDQEEREPCFRDA